MKKKIMIMEPEVGYRKFLLRFFSESDFSPTAVNSERNALLLLKHDRFDAAIVEFCANGKPAEKLCGEIQKISDKTSLILMCRRQSPGLERKARQYAPVFYFVKPINIDNLYAVVLKVFESKKRKQQQLMEAVTG